MRNRLLLAVLPLLAALSSACEREQRRFENPKPSEDNAYSVAQGKQLFRWFNCSGCHAGGGGGMGPALMDREWRYGSEREKVFATIMDGRPDGMPAFRRRLTEEQAWQLVAYVRSMSGKLKKDVAPGRNDGIAAGEPENRRQRQ